MGGLPGFTIAKLVIFTTIILIGGFIYFFIFNPSWGRFPF